MPDRPPPLDNGYLWIAHTILTAAGSQTLGRRLDGIRHEIRTTDRDELGDPRHLIEVEVWAHPDDQGRVAEAFRALHEEL